MKLTKSADTVSQEVRDLAVEIEFARARRNSLAAQQLEIFQSIHIPHHADKLADISGQLMAAENELRALQEEMRSRLCPPVCTSTADRWFIVADIRRPQGALLN